MKRIVSVSLGSSRRNHTAEFEVLGERVVVERVGTDGDLARAVQMVRELDGKVDAFGMGGIDLYIHAGGRRYEFRDARAIAQAAQKTPIVDGSGLKNTLERRVVQHLQDRGIVALKGMKVLMVSAVDRFGMAEALVQAGADVSFGDLIFALGVPVAIRSLGTLDVLARLLLPVLTRLPFKWLYPTGDQQERVSPRYARYYHEHRMIAGDFHFIRRYMPANLAGKVILTNTVTRDDVAELKRRGVALLVTTTPEIQGRSFGTNVMEAFLVAMAGKRPEEMTPADYEQWLDRLDFQPRVERLGDGATGQAS